MRESKSSATLRALADLADLSATQLQEGRSVDEVIDVLRKAATAVRAVVQEQADNDRIRRRPVVLSIVEKNSA
ncbi:hypothetical protein [Roseibium sp. RKSG952]|uniref:hypothetical protein n=1 Tax=Roseibium sp. RKSG952 TaxID=2529384 RepID=UPI0012BC45D1|nr:hypothetical protein [Roseibium sp. RKSG952]MTI01057.1 hypothetical protein [Roseibium sp. RKSG952]